jgi:hypothetical protein
MVLGFGKKKKAPKPPVRQSVPELRTNQSPADAAPKQKFEFTFKCQVAHGGPVCDVKDFRNIKELFQRMAEAVNVDPNKILFVTVNEAKVRTIYLYTLNHPSTKMIKTHLFYLTDYDLRF